MSSVTMGALPVATVEKYRNVCETFWHSNVGPGTYICVELARPDDSQGIDLNAVPLTTSIVTVVLITPLPSVVPPMYLA